MCLHTYACQPDVAQSKSTYLCTYVPTCLCQPTMTLSESMYVPTYLCQLTVALYESTYTYVCMYIPLYVSLLWPCLKVHIHVYQPIYVSLLWPCPRVRTYVCTCLPTVALSESMYAYVPTYGSLLWCRITEVLLYHVAMTHLYPIMC